jgi:hypothetical protein
MRQVEITSWREEKKSGASLGEDYLYWFELSLDIVSQDKCCVSCGCVFLSDLVLMLLLSIELQRTIIMA